MNGPVQTDEVLIFGETEALKSWPPAPPWAYNYLALLCQAEQSLDRREQAYPEWIRAGRIASDAAADDIAAWRLIVREWRCIVRGPDDLGAELPAPQTLAARRAAINLSLERIEAEARRRRMPDLQDQHERLTALQWHLGRVDGPESHGAPRVHRLARLSRLLRQDAATRAIRALKPEGCAA
jgi:hypothetical protein